jgi:hypothetical protein
VPTEVQHSEPVKFTGLVVRIEADGFGIVRFDNPIGPSANQVGLLSSSTTYKHPK